MATTRGYYVVAAVFLAIATIFSIAWIFTGDDVRGLIALAAAAVSLRAFVSGKAYGT